MTKTGFQNIFPVPIYTTFLDSKFVDKMEDLIVPRLNNLQPTAQQKTDFYLKNKIISSKEFYSFIEYIKKIIVEYANKSNFVLPNNIQYWVQDYTKNEYHSSHTHGGAIISGVYYVRASDKVGNLKFTNPNPLFNTTNLKHFNGKEEINFYITPQKGLLVLFPGWLLHEVEGTIREDYIRTSLIFNLY